MDIDDDFIKLNEDIKKKITLKTSNLFKEVYLIQNLRITNSML
jgi:hypothetical protein